MNHRTLANWVWRAVAAGVLAGVGGLQLIQLAIETRTAAGEAVVDMAFSPDGKDLATASEYNAVYFWKLAGAELPKVFSLPRHVPVSVRFTGEGNRIITGAHGFLKGSWTVKSARIDIWNPDTAICERTVDIPGGYVGDVECASPNVAVAVLKGSVARYDLETGQTLERIDLPADAASHLCRAPDGRFLVYGSPASTRRVNVWDSVRREFLFDQDDTMVLVHEVAMSPDCRMVAACGRASGRMGRLSVWNLADGRELGVPFAVPELFRVAFTPDGKSVLATNMQGRINVWNISDAGYLDFDREFAADGRVERLVFSPDGSRVAMVTSTSLSIYDYATGDKLQTLVEPLRLYSFRRVVRWSKFLLVIAAGIAMIWSLRHRIVRRT
ncbi:MAG TPA: WD40 repeat domain-containing protein [Pirellulales bacterium]|jgi:WD40 repeat protein|nr:WD40 repeat domain-containing protein [Pirellulales bacterium]